MEKTRAETCNFSINKNLTKDELEAKGRELGVELDKRKTKDKLIAEIDYLLKKG